MLADEVLDCSGNAPKSTECCSICNTSLAETPGIPTSFCCQCSCRLHNECKVDWYTKSYVTERARKSYAHSIHAPRAEGATSCSVGMRISDWDGKPSTSSRND